MLNMSYTIFLTYKKSNTGVQRMRFREEKKQQGKTYLLPIILKNKKWNRNH